MGNQFKNCLSGRTGTTASRSGGRRKDKTCAIGLEIKKRKACKACPGFNHKYKKEIRFRKMFFRLGLTRADMNFLVEKLMKVGEKAKGAAKAMYNVAKNIIKAKAKMKGINNGK